jgi:hypothetical protein
MDGRHILKYVFFKKDLKEFKIMVRFIFLCMGVVALSFVAIGAQYMMQDMEGAQSSVMARNAETQDAAQTQGGIESAAIQEDGFSPESLNQIETSAGAITTTAQDDGGFGAAFTNTAPKALGDDTPQAAMPVADGLTDVAN